MNRLPYSGDTSAMKVTYAEAPVRFEESLFALAVVLAAIPLRSSRSHRLLRVFCSAQRSPHCSHSGRAV